MLYNTESVSRYFYLNGDNIRKLLLGVNTWMVIMMDVSRLKSLVSPNVNNGREELLN